MTVAIDVMADGSEVTGPAYLCKVPYISQDSCSRQSNGDNGEGVLLLKVASGGSR